MIVTVTLNPLLERRYSFRRIDYAGMNRGGVVTTGAGGKGINISRQLNLLNTPNLAFTFLGGINGRLFKEVLNAENINFTSVKINSQTREGVVLIDEETGKITSLFGANPGIEVAEADEFKKKLEKIIQNCEIIIFAGSSPCKDTDSIIPFGIELANRYDKISVCDTYGAHLPNCIKAGPTILHNNIDELQKSLGTDLNSEESILNLLDILYSYGIKQAYITNAEKNFYASNFDFHFKVTVPSLKSIDSTGSGDCFTAGIIYSWHHDLTFENGLKFATSLGAVNASRYDTGNVTLKDADGLKSQVEVTAVGKRMKTLDVTPR